MTESNEENNGSIHRCGNLPFAVSGCRSVVTFDTLPPSIHSFLIASFPDIPVEKIEKDFCPAYKVELSNGLELEFNSKGICKDIDD